MANLTTLEAYNLVKSAARQAKALAVLEDALFDVASLDAQKLERTAEIARARQQVDAAKTEAAGVLQVALDDAAATRADAEKFRADVKAQADLLTAQAKKDADAEIKRVETVSKSNAVRIAAQEKTKAELDTKIGELTAKRDELHAAVEKLRAQLQPLLG